MRKPGRILLGTVIALALVGVFWRLPAAEASGSNCLPSDRLPVTLMVRGQGQSDFTTVSDGPYIDSRLSRTYSPGRDLFRAMDPESSVGWDGPTRTATFTYLSHTLSVRFPPALNETFVATLDGQVVGMHVFLCQGRAFVPVRTVASLLNLEVSYFDGLIVTVDAIE